MLTNQSVKNSFSSHIKNFLMLFFHIYSFIFKKHQNTMLNLILMFFSLLPCDCQSMAERFTELLKSLLIQFSKVRCPYNLDILIPFQQKLRQQKRIGFLLIAPWEIKHRTRFGIQGFPRQYIKKIKQTSKKAQTITQCFLEMTQHKLVRIVAQSISIYKYLVKYLKYQSV